MRLACRWTASNADLFQQLGQTLPSSKSAHFNYVLNDGIGELFTRPAKHRPSEADAPDRDFCDRIRQTMLSTLLDPTKLEPSLNLKALEVFKAPTCEP